MRHVKLSNQAGFTLIELMVVVAIVGILTAVATPVYQNFLIRSQVSEGLILTGAVKTALTEYYQINGAAPANNSVVGLPLSTDISGSFVSSVGIYRQNNTEAVVTIEYGNTANAAIDGYVLDLIPTFGNGTTTWVCDNSDFGGTGANYVPNQYLPQSCY